MTPRCSGLKLLNTYSKTRIGYNRAARLLEQMEKSGLVSAMATNGNRELIVPKREE